MHAIYDDLVDAARDACRRHYGSRLVSVAVFGSVGRGTPGPDSDIDLLVVVEQLPQGRLTGQTLGAVPWTMPRSCWRWSPAWSAGAPRTLDSVNGRLLFDFRP